MERKKSKSSTLSTFDILRRSTNVWSRIKQTISVWFVQQIPGWITLNGAALIGLLGNMVIGLSFALAAFTHINWLYISTVGLLINKLGKYISKYLKDYRMKQIKWYSFIFEFTMNWIGVFIISFGLMLYMGSPFFLLALFLIILSAWQIILSLLQLQVTDDNSSKFEILSTAQLWTFFILMTIAEIFIPYSIIYSCIFLIALFLVTNIIRSIELFAKARNRDTDAEKFNEKDIRRILDDFFYPPAKFNSNS